MGEPNACLVRCEGLLYDTAAKIADEFVREIPDLETVAIGGSLARGFSDSVSDIETYVYYSGELPTKQQISNVLARLGAHTTRSPDLHWHHPAWGIHTFFGVGDVKVELGYRDTKDIRRRMAAFLAGNILSKHGIHDTPFGHYESGVASCLCECVPLHDNGFLSQIRRRLDPMPAGVKNDLISYYFDDCRIIVRDKLSPAAERNDQYGFNSYLSMALRGLIITLFSLNHTYYPGDKWTQEYFARFPRLPAQYAHFERRLFGTCDYTRANKLCKVQLLRKTIAEVAGLIGSCRSETEGMHD